MFEEAIAIWRELGQGPWLAMALNNLGKVQIRRGELDAARVHLLEALSLAHRWAIGGEWPTRWPPSPRWPPLRATPNGRASMHAAASATIARSARRTPPRLPPIVGVGIPSMAL